MLGREPHQIRLGMSRAIPAGDDRVFCRQQYSIIQQRIDPSAYATPELYQEVKNFMEKAVPLSPTKEL